VDFGGVSLTSTALGNTDAIIAKYAGADGSLRWAHNFPSGGDDSAASVAVDRSDNIIFAGSFSGSINYGGGTLTSTGVTDVSVVKLSSGGTFLWAKRFGNAAPSSGVDYAHTVAVDRNGDVLVTGNYAMGSMPVGTTTLTSGGTSNAFLFKLSGVDGGPLWATSAASLWIDYGLGVATDSANNVVFTGYFANSASFRGTTLTSAGASQDVFVAKYTSSGGLVWAERFGDVSDESASSVATDSSGNIAITGAFRQATNVLGTPLTSAGSTDAILVSLTP